MRRLLATLLTLAACSAHAANRCTDAKGRVTFQDAPCEASVSGRPVDTSVTFSTKPGQSSVTPGATIVSTAPDPAYSTTRGAWRGPAQLHLTVGAQRLDPEGVRQMVLEIKPDGSVSGFIDSTGCRLAGLATQLILPTIAQLDLTASGCSDSRFNGRYQGQLGSVANAKEGRLSLSTFAGAGAGQQTRVMSVAAVLKR